MVQITEQDNPSSASIDIMETIDAVRLINSEDHVIAAAIERVLPEIAMTIETVAQRLHNGGRLFYIGTGTSGRLGVLDASELPPTFGVSRDLVKGIIAGGYEALYKAVEASEDDREAGASDLKDGNVNQKDAVIGIAASGGTPYTIGAVEYARSLGCFTACITCNPDSSITKEVDTSIVAVVGPEVISGSTRMKSGTAQKMILNMISTMVMVKLGYVRGNHMVNVKSANKKLVERSQRLLIKETDLAREDALALFDSAGRDLKTALVMHEANVDRDAAIQALEDSELSVAKAVLQLSRRSE